MECLEVLSNTYECNHPIDILFYNNRCLLVLILCDSFIYVYL